MSASLDKAKDRIRKLLEVARDDAATQGEIDNALSFAKSMMDAYHLSEDDLSTEPADQYAEIEKAPKGQVFSWVGSKMYRWEVSLARFAAEFVGGVGYFLNHEITMARTRKGIAIRDNGKIKVGKKFCFYGIAEDAALAAELFEDLRTTIAGMAVLKFGACYKGDGGSYSEGFVEGLRCRLSDNEDKARAAASDSRSLVLIERRADLIERKLTLAKDFLKASGVELRSGGGRYGASGSRAARNEGYADGKRTPVNAARTPKIGS